MYLIGPENARMWTDTNRNFTLRHYGRLEYGSPDIGWIVASAKAAQLSPKRRPRRSLGMRLRYFLNSFRGFAVLDVHGHDETRGT